jgi:predicted component of type VI protein secretion system
VARFHLAVTAAFLALSVFFFSLLPSPALACISCEYTPEVVNTPVRGAKTKANKVAKPQRATPPKKHIARKPAAKPPVAAPANAPAEPATEAAKADEALRTEAAPKDVATTTPATPVVEEETVAQPSSSAPTNSATIALGRQGIPTKTEAEAEPEKLCRKFSAQAGVVVTVPCD